MRGPFLSFDDVLCKAETDKAVLCDVQGNEVWIPKGQIHDDSEVFARNGKGRLVVTQWIAEQKKIDGIGDEYEED